MRKHWIALAASLVLGSSMTASAQHAGFVLFGKPNPDAAVAPKENQFVHPVTVPYYHEDSFVTTDVRAWFVHHDFPSSGVIDGGYARDYALQIRVALTDQIQLVAYKDGYLDFDAGLLSDSGWNDLAAGLKWNFLQDWKNNLHAAVGAGYEFPIGDADVLQNDGEVRVWASVNKGFGKLHLGATVNGLFRLDSEDSNRLYWNTHADYYVCNWFSPVVEVNGYHTLTEADGGTPPFSGVDVADIGGGDDVVTLGLGGELRLIKDLAIRAAYELPLTDADNDLYGWRITASLIYSF